MWLSVIHTYMNMYQNCASGNNFGFGAMETAHIPHNCILLPDIGFEQLDHVECSQNMFKLYTLCSFTYRTSNPAFC